MRRRPTSKRRKRAGPSPPSTDSSGDEGIDMQPGPSRRPPKPKRYLKRRLENPFMKYIRQLSSSSSSLDFNGRPRTPSPGRCRLLAQAEARVRLPGNADLAAVRLEVENEIEEPSAEVLRAQAEAERAAARAQAEAELEAALEAKAAVDSESPPPSPSDPHRGVYYPIVEEAIRKISSGDDHIEGYEVVRRSNTPPPSSRNYPPEVAKYIEKIEYRRKSRKTETRVKPPTPQPERPTSDESD